MRPLRRTTGSPAPLRVVAKPAPPAPAPARVPAAGHSGGTCACVVTCHNYARYLRECLDSILAQTQPFEAVIVVDDASDDDTPAVCAAYEARGIRYLRAEFRDVAQARNAGVAALPRTRFLLFVDADNALPPNYREALQGAMGAPNIGVTYCHLDRMDDAGRPLGRSLSVQPYDYWRLRIDNYADTCSLIRREAWDQVGGWRSNRYGMHDWLLWLRITRAGWGMRLVDGTALRYRVHSGAMSEARHGRYECGAEVMRDGHLTALVTLFSGREWMLDRYFTALGNLAWNRENLHLVAVDNACNRDFSSELRRRLAATGLGYTYVADTRRARADVAPAEFAGSRQHRSTDGYALNVHMARLYSLAGEHLPAGTDLVWTVEDDVTVPPDALWHLCLGLFRDKGAGVAAGVLRSRFADRLIAWRRMGDEPHKAGYYTEPPEPGTYEDVRATGFYCTVFRRQVWERLAFRPSMDWTDHNVAYDWAAAQDVTGAGWRWLLAGSVRCGHWQGDGTCLTP